MLKEVTIKGRLIDAESRCVHWNSRLDIIALKLKCCESFYACYSCHQELTHKDHATHKYNINKSPMEHVILCGVCKNTMTFQKYTSRSFGEADQEGISTQNQPFCCPFCNSPFNPGCKLHYDLYFDFDHRDHRDCEN
ncbi:Hot13p Ecym_3408 [Eremothecium cymbalariae DBVPG|uniref:CHY-type domain-containing protein n=1 Tax=Eremothecium cymbalariae (strain CBS 270.75 / DBVPG 7215 / KCTC 17166 / NRRL Y-17582) TaxID=931890 RepID=G8JRX5_ERECY|nr:Hypothetical protein Ecym_3408 [Eremothecium cymbalariae DBVPG\